MKIFFISIIITFFFIGCGDADNSDNKLFKVYEDIAVARESIDDIDSANVVIDSILNSYGYTEKEFRKAIFDLRKEDPEMFIQIIDSVKKNAIQKSIELDSLKNLKLKSETKTPADSNK